MEENKFLSVIKNKKQTIFAIVLFCFIFVGIITALQPFLYKTESKILVYQDNTDPYAMSKSGQYLSSLLVNVIKTGSFYEEVVNSGYNIDVLYFSANEKDRLRIWKKTVETAVVDDSGVFSVFVYHADRYQSKQIAQAINYVIKTKHDLYHGAGEKVMIKIVDSPVSSNFPVRPRFVLNFLAGILTGLVLSAVYIYLFPESRFDIRLFPQKKVKPKTVDSSEKQSEEERRNIENAKQIKREIQEALVRAQTASIKERQRNDDVVKKEKRVYQEKKSLDIENKKTGTIDIEDIERDGSMNNIIGFLNLGN